MNILDYLGTAFDTFATRPLGNVDALILTQLSMVRAEELVPERPSSLRALPRALFDASVRAYVRPADLMRAELYDRLFTGLASDRLEALLCALAASPRFRELRISHPVSLFDPERHTQFAAATYAWGRGSGAWSFVAFRGTDTSFTGWREDFNMAIEPRVPAQEQAARYLERVAQRTRGPLYVGGHSKGGNLATYAVAMASQRVRDRVARVWSFDGPGFLPQTLSVDEYALARPLLTKIVPNESYIGMLLERDDELLVARNTAHGIAQHSAFTWEIDPDTLDFAWADKLSDSSSFFRQVMSDWVGRYSREELEQFTEELFAALQSTDAHDIDDLLAGGPKTAAILGQAVQNAGDDGRRVVFGMLGQLGQTAARRAGDGITGAVRSGAATLARALRRGRTTRS